MLVLKQLSKYTFVTLFHGCEMVTSLNFWGHVILCLVRRSQNIIMTSIICYATLRIYFQREPGAESFLTVAMMLESDKLGHKKYLAIFM